MEAEQEILRQIRELKQLTTLQLKEVLTVDELKLLTGFKKSYIYQLLFYKRIPHYKDRRGTRVYFKRKEIEQWMCYNRIPTNEEALQTAILHCETHKKGGK